MIENIENIVRYRVFDYNLAGIELTPREQAIKDRYQDQHIIYRPLSDDEIEKLSERELLEIGISKKYLRLVKQVKKLNNLRGFIGRAFLALYKLFEQYGSLFDQYASFVGIGDKKKQKYL